MDGHEFLDPLMRLLDGISAPARVREVEATRSIDTLWSALKESGFLDALTSEEAGGAGLSLAQVGPLLQAVGFHAVSAPVAETMLARALLRAAAIEPPEGPIVLASPAVGHAMAVPLALVSEHVLIDTGSSLILASLGDAKVSATGVKGCLAAHLAWEAEPTGPSMRRPARGLRPIAAILRAAAIAGAADRLLQMTVSYANQRVQFGKPIGKQQAIQQQLAVMAEQTVLARIAAQIGLASGLPPSLAAAATAKQVTSSAAPQVANIAHAVHGAIGISEEYDLQVFSRRLHEWRLADGSESYWAAVLGRERIDAGAWSSVDFVRERIAAPCSSVDVVCERIEGDAV
jgi:alkylation response protein AidB-like acyl-CoA dehydrogenase